MSFPGTVEERYRHDAVFNRVVDQMRALLRMYQITPSELREASILAATMHAQEHIAPLFFYANGGLDLESRLFGPGVASNAPLRTASGAAAEIGYPRVPLKVEASGRVQSSKPNQSNTPKEATNPVTNRRNPKAVADRRINVFMAWDANARGKWERSWSASKASNGDRRIAKDRRIAAPSERRKYGSLGGVPNSGKAARRQGAYHRDGKHRTTGDRRIGKFAPWPTVATKVTRTSHVFVHSLTTKWASVTVPFSVCNQCGLSDVYVKSLPKEQQLYCSKP